MANTNISFAAVQDAILATPSSIPLNAGDTLTFAAPTDGSTPVLYFSPDLTNILTPTPAGGLTLDPSNPSVFTVAAVQPAAFTIVVTASVEFPPSFPSGSSTTLSFVSLADYQQMPPIVGTSFDPPVKSGS